MGGRLSKAFKEEQAIISESFGMALCEAAIWALFRRQG